jgi:hypothetical protein
MPSPLVRIVSCFFVSTASLLFWERATGKVLLGADGGDRSSEQAATDLSEAGGSQPPSAKGLERDAHRVGAISFDRQVRPILAKHCYACHGPDKAEAGLRLSEHATATQPADSGSVAIRPGQPEQSELIARISSADASMRMPPEGEGLPAASIEILRKWIDEGAEYTSHWSFQPVTRPPIPACDGQDWIENPIDAFLLHSLEQAGLTPNPPAARRTLLRRLYYNMLGIPPTAAEIDRFEDDASATWWEVAVDRLLADPRLGERWGRHWLDVVRYAETNSFERDGPKPNAWKYRDYVIRAFNHDKPYDRFLIEQLAGDEVDTPTVESLTATGYYRLGIWDDEPADPLQAEFDGLDDLVTVTGQGMLGLTFNCARCHDHKVDPIPQRDYYQLVAFFRDVTPYAARGDQVTNSQIDISSPQLKSRYEEIDEALKRTRASLRSIEQRGIACMKGEDQRKTEGRQRAAVLKAQLHEHLEAEEWERYQQTQASLKELESQLKNLPPREAILGLAKCLPHPPATHVLLRGSPLAQGEPVEPGFPQMFGQALPPIAAGSEQAATAGRRKVLAEWIASPENWFTARVIVNRLWQHHFGRGLVRSSNNFGQLGEAPTHPELLDWLAAELIRQQWSLKAIHRLIVTSQAYRMSSEYYEAGIAKDPANDLFWQFPMRRLSAEELRDSVLAVSGDLNLAMFGPSIYPEVADEVKAGQSRPGQGWGSSSDSEQARRSVYIHIKRSLIPPELSVFDFPETDASCEARFLTTQAAQALGLLNGRFLQVQAERLAERVQQAAGNDRRAMIEQAVRMVYGRSANPEDQQLAESLLKKLSETHHLDEPAQWKQYCLVLLNTNEFLYLD